MSPQTLPQIDLMHPTLIARPFHRDGLVYEEKVDGYRMIAYKTGDTVKLISRNGRDHTKRCSGIAAAIRKLNRSALNLDGEVAVYDKQLVSRFEFLRHHSPPELATPPMLIAFDLLHVQGKDLRERSLLVRRNVLEDLLGGEDLVLPVRLADDG